MCFQRSLERLNVISFPDDFGQDISEGGGNIPGGPLAVPFCFIISRPENLKERSRYWSERARRGVKMKKFREVKRSFSMN